MKWLDITLGEVQAKREERERERTLCNDDPRGRRRRSVHAAMRFVVRPVLERAAGREGLAAKAKVVAEGDLDGAPVRLTLQVSRGRGRRAARLSVAADPERGVLTIGYDGGGRDALERELAADDVSPSLMDTLVERLAV